MPSAIAPLAQLLEQIRRTVFTYSGIDFTGLIPLLRQAMGLVLRLPPESPEIRGFSSDLAYLTAQMLETSHNPAFIKTALELLFKLGFLGESLAVSFALKNHMAIEHVLAILSGFPVEEQLLFANAVLREGEKRPQELTKWALALFERVENDDPEEALVFLEYLSSRADKPALAVSNALLTGRLGVWLEQLLKMRLSEEQSLYMAKVIAPLRSAGLCGLLAARAAGTSAAVIAAVCRAAQDAKGPDVPFAAEKIAAYADHPEDEARLAALAALARLDPRRCGRPLAAWYADRPDIHQSLVPILCGLNP